MKYICARGRRHYHLASSGAAQFSGGKHGVDFYFLNRVEGDREANVGLLSLINDVGRVDAVISVVVVATSAGKADASLITAASVNRASRERGQSGPVTTIQSKFIHLLLLDLRSQRI